MNTIKTLCEVRQGEKIKIIDEDLLKRLPRLKDKTLICSVLKQSGRRMFFQYFSPETGAGTLKAIGNPKVEVLGKEDFLSLAKFIVENRYKETKPTRVELNINGRISEFDIAPDFWFQNPKNIRIRHLKAQGITYSVPGASIVKQIIK